MDLRASLEAVIIRPRMTPCRWSLTANGLIECIVTAILPKDTVIVATSGPHHIADSVAAFHSIASLDIPVRSPCAIRLVLTPHSEYVLTSVDLRLDPRLLYSSASWILPNAGLTALALLWVDRYWRAQIARPVPLNCRLFTSQLLTLHPRLRRLLTNLRHLLLPHLWCGL